MHSFQFRLGQVLEWRRTQLGIEENKLLQLAAGLEELALAAAKVGLVKSRAEQNVRETRAVEAADLWALAAYRRRLLAQLEALARRRRECQVQLAAQRDRVLEAQRQCRLLEKLEDRRRAEWKVGLDREIENQAAESFLAAWHRRRS